MNLTEERYRQLKDEVESAKQEAAKATGAYEQLMNRLKEEFGCSTVGEAKTLLSKLQEEHESSQAAFTKALTAYEEKWK